MVVPFDQARSRLWKKIPWIAYHHGYTHSELASAMSTPLGTIKSWVRRGLQQLRECLGSA